jgi:hypothetical protein
MKTIEIDDDLLDLLKRYAEPFVDTPNDVLRRLLLRAKPDPTGKGSSNRRAPAHEPRAERKQGKPRRRAPSNALLSESAYELPLLKTLDDAGGRLPTREAVRAVGKAVAGELMPMDHDVLEHGRERWEMRVQFARLRLVEAGLLERESPRGVWEISRAGRERLQAADSGAR